MHIRFSPGWFRLFLALLVVTQHTTRLSLGTGAVYLFFALSGYWVCRMWDEKYVLTRRPYLTFMASRMWRLLPVFLIATALSLAAQRAIGTTWSEMFGAASPGRFWFSNLLILGYSSLAQQPVRPAWSLDIELQFYLLAPTLLLVVSRMRQHTALAVAAVITLVSAALVGGAACTSYLVFFAAGVIGAKGRWAVPRKIGLISAAAALAAIAVLLCTPLRGALLIGAHPGPLAKFGDLANIVVALIMLPAAMYSVRGASDRHDKAAADLSYVVYLFHWPAVILLTKGDAHGLGRLALLAGAWLGTGVLSLAIWAVLDRPINRFRAMWVGKRVIPAVEITSAVAQAA